MTNRATNAEKSAGEKSVYSSFDGVLVEPSDGTAKVNVSEISNFRSEAANVFLTTSKKKPYRFGKYIYEYIFTLNEEYYPVECVGKNKYLLYASDTCYIFRGKHKNAPVYLHPKSQILFRTFPEKKVPTVSFLSLYNLSPVSALRASRELMSFRPDIYFGLNRKTKRFFAENTGEV